MKKKTEDFVAIIPARTGSREVTNKNIKKLNGHSLLAYTIEAVKKSKFINKIYVSTDGKKISNIAKSYGAKVIKRPKSLSGNIIMPDDAVTHAIKYLENENLFNFKNVVFLQPTSPLRSINDIDNAIKIFKKEKSDSLFSSVDMHVAIWKQKKN